MAALPEELREEILSRLPVRSLLRLKIVCKKWYSLISTNDEFAKLQFKQLSAANNLTSTIIHVEKRHWSFQSRDCDESPNLGLGTRILNFPNPFQYEIGCPCIVGSARGLICVAPKGCACCYIWNPCTCDCKRIQLKHGFRLHGFGYDLCGDDYKILGNWDSKFLIFSLKTNSWRMLENKGFSYNLATSALYSNGALHWCLYRKIMAFDLSDEMFFEIGMPEEIIDVECSRQLLLLFDFQICLCVSHGRKMDVWVWKTKSWTKLFQILPPIPRNPLYISSIGNVECAPFGIGGECVHTESLISPNCFDNEKNKLI
ncbi:F-box/kelch-repeat protein At3g06240-like [Euphorbia lathyris]|uniref:F-box/kelch-repeat protein At3g06240-like n=1 Tax=Euphorbia lathyris TaxID=212925 RepID=UPI0033141341